MCEFDINIYVNLIYVFFECVSHFCYYYFEEILELINENNHDERPDFYFLETLSFIRH